MIRRIELQHKIKYLDKEYSVILYNDSDFTTAFKTLQYPSGKISATEKALILANPEDYSKIFIENGQRIIHFYSDENGYNEKRREFVDYIFAKYNTNKLYIFLVMPIDVTINQIHNILDDFGTYGEYCYVNVIIDSKVKKDSVRIVIGI